MVYICSVSTLGQHSTLQFSNIVTFCRMENQNTKQSPDVLCYNSTEEGEASQDTCGLPRQQNLLHLPGACIMKKGHCVVQLSLGKTQVFWCHEAGSLLSRVNHHGNLLQSRIRADDHIKTCEHGAIIATGC